MKLELSKEELTAVLDALSAQPLAKVYHLFNKLLQIMNTPEAPDVPPVPPVEPEQPTVQ